LLLAFGRFAPFYRLLYNLPYVSTVRNPVKFLHVLSFALVVLFAYGVDALARRYMQPGPQEWAGLRRWWDAITGFDRRWAIGCLVAMGLAVGGWVGYGASRSTLENYLPKVQISETLAPEIAAFSIRQVGWFVVFLGLALSLLTLALSGAFAGRRTKWGGILMGLFLVIDLGRADQPWVIYWNYVGKYANNPVLDLLSQRPYEHRVATLPKQFLTPELEPNYSLPPKTITAEHFFREFYLSEWLQHGFPFYNIQSLDVVQMPREPSDLYAFNERFVLKSVVDLPVKLVRRWQLTNTRYVLGAAGFVDFLNHFVALRGQEFRIAQRFEIHAKPGVRLATKIEDLEFRMNPDGPFALFEFTGALPRAKLYSNWEVITNAEAALARAASLDFDPQRSVVVAGGAPAAVTASAGQGGQDGKVEFTSYSPKDIVLKSEGAQPGVLLLNDRFDPSWKVWVDGRPEQVLRCNYLMRGVYLPAGTHVVEFRFQIPAGPFWVSLAALGVGVGLLGVLGMTTVTRRRNEPRPISTPSGSPPQTKPKKQGKKATRPAVASG
jgi:hypothetical protein